MWRGEGYDGGNGVDDGRFCVNDEIVVMRGGKREVSEVNEIRYRRQRLIIARFREAGEDGH
jgi:hypothetical protein